MKTNEKEWNCAHSLQRLNDHRYCMFSKTHSIKVVFLLPLSNKWQRHSIKIGCDILYCSSRKLCRALERSEKQAKNVQDTINTEHRCQKHGECQAATKKKKKPQRTSEKKNKRKSRKNKNEVKLNTSYVFMFGVARWSWSFVPSCVQR